jgi:uncharacterized damage-inducible protein DinB
MDTAEIKLLYDFNYWANGRILSSACGVSPEQYIAATDFGIGFKSLRGTLNHILDAEWSWRLRWETFLNAPLSANESDTVTLSEAQLPTLSALQDLWRLEEAAMRAYINRLSDEQVNGIVRYPLPTGGVRERILWHSLIHLVNHGTQHRGEAAALLTAYGQSPGELDFNMFLNEHFHLPSA